MWSTATWSEAGVHSIKMADGPMGISSGRVDERDISVLTPCGHALGASWDVNLVSRVGATVGNEAKRLGVDALLAPNLNLPRSPLVGRAFEMYGEDPLLSGVLGAAWIDGVASRGVGCVAKHLVCNDSETARDTMSAVIEGAALHEIYLRPFEMAAQRAGCVGVMAAYNRLNGSYCAEHRELLQEIVKRLWGFQGFLVSDWFGARDTLKSACAGLDLDMPGPDRVLGAKFAAAVTAGTVPEARLVDAASRVALGVAQIDRLPHPSLLDPALVAETLTEAAAAGFVLLRDDKHLLPLMPASTRRIAIIGPNAIAPCYQGGTFAKVGLRADARMPADVIRARFAGNAEIKVEPGVDAAPRLPMMPATPARDLGDGCKRGMTVEFFSGHEQESPPVFAETRNTNSLTWFTEMPGVGALDKPGMIRSSGWYTPTDDGLHDFFVGGTGSMRLTVDGVEYYARDSEIKPADIMGVLKAGDADCCRVALKAGHRALVEVEMRYRPARAQGLWYGVRAPSTPAAMLARAVEAARWADTVVLMVGETADAGVESKDRESTRLPAAQLALIEAIGAANSRVIAVVNVGHALDLSWDKQVAALLMVWYPGERFAEALSDVLAGTREPGGRLPVSIAARDEDYPVLSTRPDAKGDVGYSEGSYFGYRGLARAGRVPRYAFGFGLGYARIDIETVDISSMDPISVRILVKVRNSAPRIGKAVVQLYVEGPDDEAPRLEAFTALEVVGHGRAEATLVLAPRAFARWRDGSWTVAPGTHRIIVGTHSGDARFIHSVVPGAIVAEATKT
jgi:beta-glucosidase